MDQDQQLWPFCEWDTCDGPQSASLALHPVWISKGFAGFLLGITGVCGSTRLHQHLSQHPQFKGV